MFNLKKDNKQIDLLKGGAENRAHKTENIWENPKVLEVNLIKQESGSHFDWSRNLPRLIFSLFVAILFVAEIYWGLSWWEKKENERADALNAELNKVSQEIRLVKTQADEFLIFKDKAAVLPSLLQGHVYWTNFFTWLERHTLSSVSFADFSGDTGGQYVLNAQGRNFSDISYQTKAFLESPEVIKASVGAGNSSQIQDENGRVQADSSVSFSLELEVKPEIFKK